MKNILTPEDKKLLRKTCNYLGSLGMRDGYIEFEVESSHFDCEDINWSYVTHFTNNYTAEIPSLLIPLLKKVMEFVCENDLVDTPPYDDINYERIVIDIDCDTNEISVAHDFTYYEQSESESISFTNDDYENDEDFQQLFKDLEDNEGHGERILTLRYNGSGDSGYIEDYFDNGDSVPSSIEDFCYRQLENHFGGWEINEGSQGEFQIDMDEKEIVLIHTNNIEENERNTLWEETF